MFWQQQVPSHMPVDVINRCPSNKQVLPEKHPVFKDPGNRPVCRGKSALLSSSLQLSTRSHHMGGSRCPLKLLGTPVGLWKPLGRISSEGQEHRLTQVLLGNSVQQFSLREPVHTHSLPHLAYPAGLWEFCVQNVGRKTKLCCCAQD